LLIFQLKQQFATPHTLGRFRLSATTASRSDFADGLDNAGNLGMNGIWTILDPSSANSTGGAVLTEQGDNSILASGTAPTTATYAVIAPNSLLSPITGIRLEVLEDPSLPFSGPGRQATNGNFVLTELILDAHECIADQADVNDDDDIAPLTDALLLLRFVFGFRDAALTTNAVGDECMRCGAADLATYIDQLGSKLDVDGDGSVDALTDALLVLRYVFGFRGPTLIGGAVDTQNCTRCDAFLIEAYLACLLV
jgi:hypothetical protein